MKCDIRIPCLFILLTSIATPAWAQTRDGLSATVNPVAQRVRTHAPSGLEVTLTWLGSRILEGHIEFTVRDGNDVLCRYRGGEMALTSGPQAFRVMLPPFTHDGMNNQVQLDLRFAGKNQVFDLGYFPLNVGSYNQRAMTIGVSSPRAGYKPATYSLRTLQNMRFETFDQTRNAADALSVITTVAHVNTEDLPVHPLGYCQFDVLVLGEEGFTGLKEKQLDAVARWVEGGGSVLVVPLGKLQPYHVSFVNRLAGLESEPVKAFVVDADNQVAVADRDAARMRNQVAMYRSGLGRSVVALALPADDDLKMASWRNVVMFLWKTTENRSAWLLTTGQGSGRDADIDRLARFGFPGIGQTPPLSGGATLLQALMPQSTRMIPFPVIVMILGGFLLVIGPLDYFGLGLIRARRFTWLVFPVMSVVFTLSTMELAARYMGRSDHRNKMTIIDVGAGGRVLRRNIVEVMFTAREITARTELKNALMSVVDGREMSLQAFSADDWRSGRQMGTAVDAAIGSYVGPFPQQYVLEQPVRQWSPVTMRTLSFEPAAEAPMFDWDGVAPLLVTTGQRDDAQIVNTLLRGESRDCAVYLQRLSNLTLLGPVGGKLRVTGVGPVNVSHLAGVIQNLNARQSVGLFAVVAQFSPNGGAILEDVAVLDPTDPRQTLLIVVEKKGSDYVVHRRLYTGLN